MEITAKPAGVLDPKDRREKEKTKTVFWRQDEIHGQTADMVSMTLLLAHRFFFKSSAMLCLQHIGNWNMQVQLA